MSYYPNQNDDGWRGSGSGDTSGRGGSAHELYSSRSSAARDDSAYAGRATSSRDVFGSARGNEEDHFGGYGGTDHRGVGIGIGYNSSQATSSSRAGGGMDSSSPYARADDPSPPRKRSPNNNQGANTNSAAVMPLPVEGMAMPPDFAPQEPPMPTPRVSKRFPSFSKRQPDMMLGKVVDTDKASVRGEAHLVNCTECRCRMKVKKFAVLVRCPDCSRVSPASSSKGAKYV